VRDQHDGADTLRTLDAHAHLTMVRRSNVIAMTAILLIPRLIDGQQELAGDRVIRAVEAEIEQALGKSSLELKDSIAAEYADRFRADHPKIEIPGKTLARINSTYSRLLEAGAAQVAFIPFALRPMDTPDTVARGLGNVVFIRIAAWPADSETVTAILAHELGHDKYDCVRWGMVKKYYGERHLDEYQRRMESRADQAAIHLLHKAGLDTSLVVRYLDRMYVQGVDKTYRLAATRQQVAELAGRR
jgi:predicted Zn-dependent protease